MWCSSRAEDGHATGADEETEDDQHDADDDRSLDQLEYSDYDEDGGYDPKDGCVHDGNTAHCFQGQT